MRYRSEYSVFLCHNSKEKLEINVIRDLLEKRNIHTFMDQYSFNTFEPWENQLKEEIKNFKAVAIFLGKSGLGPYQAKEIRMLFEKIEKDSNNRRIGLVILPGCSSVVIKEVTQQWSVLSERHWADFSQDEPDPFNELMLGVSFGSHSKTLDYKQSLLNSLENRKLRAELFKIAADSFQDQAKKLFRAIQFEKERIRNIESEMNQAELDAVEEHEINPELYEAAKIFKSNLKSCVEKAVEFALTNNSKFQDIKGSPVEFQIKVNYFRAEIEKYFLRIHTSLITSRFNILQEGMEHKSGFSSSIHTKALSYLKTMIQSLQFNAEIEAEFINRIERLNKIIACR